jgi:cellulose synthase/poly-beta-1,6-N-acetylglucosamine synthase-like glycosyltransferase
MDCDTPLVSIILPHYQTPDLARLCLRTIRHFTNDLNYEVIVVDNNSQDGESLEYLRQVEWIRLVERTENVGIKGKGHKEAVDIGIEMSRGKYVLAFHTDSIPVSPDWLSWHVLQLESNPQSAAVGTYKLEIKSEWQLALKQLERFRFWKQLSSDSQQEYIRSHCALYQKDALQQTGLKYDDPEGDVAGRSIHFGLIKAGYISKLLSVDETLRKVVHLNHGTMVMRPELGARQATIRKGHQRIAKFLAQPWIQAIYQNVALDRLKSSEQNQSSTMPSLVE